MPTHKRTTDSGKKRQPKPFQRRPGNKRWDAILEMLPVLPKGETLAGAEVGVWLGRTSEELLKARSDLYMIMVDRWCPPPPGDSYRFGDMPKYPAEKFEAARQQAYARTRPYKDRRIIYETTSAEAVLSVTDQTLDFVFIDGDHSLEGTVRDILMWLPKVKPGGIICGHDYCRPDKGQVQEAVAMVFGKADFYNQLILSYDHTWFFKLSDDFVLGDMNLHGDDPVWQYLDKERDDGEGD